MTINLNRQIYIYSLDSSAFYTDSEHKIHKKLLKSYWYRDHLKNKKGDYNKNKK